MGLKDLLGKGCWYIKLARTSSSGVDQEWSDINTDPRTLVADLKRIGAYGPADPPQYAYYRQWKRVGRRIQHVEVKRVYFGELGLLPEWCHEWAGILLDDMEPEHRTLDTLLRIRENELTECPDGQWHDTDRESLNEWITVIKEAIAKRDEQAQVIV